METVDLDASRILEALLSLTVLLIKLQPQLSNLEQSFISNLSILEHNP